MDEMPKAYVKLNDTVLRTMLNDIYQRNTIEACGVLLGYIDEQKNWLAIQAHPLHNTAESAVYFEFDPEELLTVEMTQELPIIGVYHSHPTGYPIASATDRNNMERINLQQQIPWVWLIVCGPFSQTDEQDKPHIIAYHHYPESGLYEVPIHFSA